MFFLCLRGFPLVPRALPQRSSVPRSSPHCLHVLQALTPLLRSCFRDNDATAAIFVPSCTSTGAFQEVQCWGGECWCVDPQGQEVSGSRISGHPPRCPSHCERQRTRALNVKANMAAGAQIYIPACSEAGDFLPLQCVGSRCFCVDTEGKSSTGSAGGAVSCKTSHWAKRLSFLCLTMIG